MVSRRRKKELKRLRKGAEELWLDQQALFERANLVFREGSKQATHLTQEEVLPRLKTAYEDHLKESVDKSFDAGSTAFSNAQKTVLDTIVPAITSAAAAANAIAGEVRTRLGSASDEVGKRAEKAKSAAKAAGVLTAVKTAKKAIEPEKKGIGAGGVVGIVLGTLVVAGIGYAVWQTLRADDDLWVADDEPEIPAAENTTPPQ